MVISNGSMMIYISYLQHCTLSYHHIVFIKTQVFGISIVLVDAMTITQGLYTYKVYLGVLELERNVARLLHHRSETTNRAIVEHI